MRKKSPEKEQKEKLRPVNLILKKDQQRPGNRGLFRPQELIVVGSIVVLGIGFLIVNKGFDVLKNDLSRFSSHLQIGSENLKPAYKNNLSVQISPNAKKTIGKKALSDYQGWIGKIRSADQVETKDGKSVMTYQITFDNGDSIKGVKEADLKQAPKAKFSVEKTIQVRPDATTDVDGYDLTAYQGQAAKVTNITPNYTKGGGYKYDLLMDDGVNYTNVAEASLKAMYAVKLKDSNSASQNNQILKDALTYAKNNPGTVLSLPSGSFTIGTQGDPTKDYLTLASDTQIRGDNTTLLIDGAQYWLGFATGPTGYDGVTNFTMKNLTIQAKDTSKGAHFMVMTNHGANWNISNNKFVMVHKMGSHVFDLGGLQDSGFYNNSFEGYAPELTGKTNKDGISDDHDIYSEAIQFDSSDDTGVWDGNILKAIDKDYASHNANKVATNGIIVSGNQFIPYKNSSGKLIAYSASIGQHSSDVTNITVTNNTFTDTLTKRFDDGNWVYEPIHFTPNSSVSEYSNVIN